MLSDVDSFVINNTQDDFCRQCGSRECNGCGCTWCRENQAKYFDVLNEYGLPEQLCQECYNVRITDLPAAHN